MPSDFIMRKKDSPLLLCGAFEKKGFIAAFSTRSHGNMAFPNDDTSTVDNRRGAFLASLGLANRPLQAVRQIHSGRCINADLTTGLSENSTEADALVSSRPDVLLAVKTADCLPLLIADPKSGAFAAVHAGWKGVLNDIIESSVDRLRSDFHVQTEFCLAALGPSACGTCYEVESDVANEFNKRKDVDLSVLSKHTADKWKLNIPQLAKAILHRCGFQEKRIFVSPYCPMHDNDLFFSHRKDPDRPAGRFLSVVGRL